MWVHQMFLTPFPSYLLPTCLSLSYDPRSVDGWMTRLGMVSSLRDWRRASPPVLRAFLLADNRSDGIYLLLPQYTGTVCHLSFGLCEHGLHYSCLGESPSTWFLYCLGSCGPSVMDERGTLAIAVFPMMRSVAFASWMPAAVWKLRLHALERERRDMSTPGGLDRDGSLVYPTAACKLELKQGCHIPMYGQLLFSCGKS